jgi:hypothetical protein
VRALENSSDTFEGGLTIRTTIQVHTLKMVKVEGDSDFPRKVPECEAFRATESPFKLRILLFISKAVQKGTFSSVSLNAGASS